MKYIGAHVSTEGGVFNAPLHARDIGATAFACFVKNQRRWFSKPYSTSDIKQFQDYLHTVKIIPEHILVHAGYLINLGHPEATARQHALNSFIEEIHLCEQLGLKKIVVHPGTHLRMISEEECLDNIVSSLNAAIVATDKVILVLENTAGQGGCVGYKFEHLGYVLKRVDKKKRVGVCIDTCHLFAAGYDFTTSDKYEDVWQQFARNIGFKYLMGMHLNDSKTDIGSRVDRHESLGKGRIGSLPFRLLMQDQRLNDLPFVLETPEPNLWPAEIKLLSRWAFTT